MLRVFRQNLMWIKTLIQTELVHIFSIHVLLKWPFLWHSSSQCLSDICWPIWKSGRLYQFTKSIQNLNQKKYRPISLLPAIESLKISFYKSVSTLKTTDCFLRVNKASQRENRHQTSYCSSPTNESKPRWRIRHPGHCTGHIGCIRHRLA